MTLQLQHSIPQCSHQLYEMVEEVEDVLLVNAETLKKSKDRLALDTLGPRGSDLRRSVSADVKLETVGSQVTATDAGESSQVEADGKLETREEGLDVVG